MITLAELEEAARANEDAGLSLKMPDGEFVPAHFHVTEVAHLQKDFIDCGGTRRSESSCVLQTYVAHDVEHRLTAGKLAKILGASASVLPGKELPVAVDIQETSISTYLMENVERSGSELVIQLASKNTDCLAKDHCGIGEAPAAILNAGIPAAGGLNLLGAEEEACCDTGST